MRAAAPRHISLLFCRAREERREIVDLVAAEETAGPRVSPEIKGPRERL